MIAKFQVAKCPEQSEQFDIQTQFRHSMFGSAKVMCRSLLAQGFISGHAAVPNCHDEVFRVGPAFEFGNNGESAQIGN